FHLVKFGAPEPMLSRSAPVQLIPENVASFTIVPLIYTAPRLLEMVNATCTHVPSAAISAAVPPSTHTSEEPVPIFNFIRCLPAAPASLNNLKPLVLSLFVGPGGVMLIIPARSGTALTLYQNTALISGFLIVAEGSVT